MNFGCHSQFMVQAFQLYNAYRLFQLYMATDIDCNHWQVHGSIKFCYLCYAKNNTSAGTTFIFSVPGTGCYE